MAFNFYDIIKKIVCFLLIVACVGLPIISVFSFAMVFIAGLAIVNGKINRSFKRLIVAVLIAIFVFVIKGMFPHAAIQEGHNIFFTKSSGEILEKELPPDVFAFMKEQFLRRYPLDKRAIAGTGCWQSSAPESLFVFSSDSAFSKPKYSRIVDEINFSNLAQFRGGFANSLEYNWFGASDIKRESMPFFVMYELSPASVDSSLCWRGYVLWEEAGHYKTIYNQEKACRKITKSDIGRKVFGVAINNEEQKGFRARFRELKTKIKYLFSRGKEARPLEDNKEAYLSIQLRLSPVLLFFLVLKRAIEAMGVFFILLMMLEVNRKRFISSILIIGLACVITYLYCPELFGQYFVNEGGEDGITHATLGREILVNALSGNWKQALRGGQDVYWDSPGFRYFRAVEKLFFGDTNLGYLAVILILPYVLFGFLGNFISKRWALWTTLFFLLGVILHSHEVESLGFTYHIYVMVVRGGWPDALGYTAFLGGLTLALRYIKMRDGAYLWYGFLAHFLLFITVFMRHNYSIAALIVLLYLAGRMSMERRFKEIFISWFGFIPVLLPLMHNYFFGGKPYLFTGAVYMAITTPPSVYFNAFRELLAFNFAGENLGRAVLQLKHVICPWYRAIFLGLVFYAAFLKRKMPSDMRMIAIVCLSLHFVNLFIFATYFRYVFLAWALTVIIAVFLFWLRLKERKVNVIQGKAGVVR